MGAWHPLTDVLTVVIVGELAGRPCSHEGPVVERLPSRIDLTTEYVAFVESGDELAADAVASVLSELARNPDIDVLYGDEDRLDENDRRCEPFHKPAWSPDRLRAHHLLGGFVVYRSALVREALRLEGCSSSASVDEQLHDLALKVTEQARVIAHVPRVLCHRRSMNAQHTGHDRVAAVQRHCRRIDFSMDAVDGPAPSIVAFRPRPLTDPPLVSIIVPTGGAERLVRGQKLRLVDNALISVLEHSTHHHIEIVVVVDAKSTARLAARLRALDPRVIVVKDERPFNFAAACNLGVAASAGSMVILLNDDTEVVTPDWIERLVAYAELDHVGAVGAKLFYADGRIQHAGVATRDTGPDHLYHGYPGTDSGHGEWLRVPVNAFAATGACLAVSRRKWDDVGGMDEGFPLNYNDIDLCLRLTERGWSTVVDNQTELLHLETSSRNAGSENWEVEKFRERWPGWITDDPHDNPNLVTIGLEQIPKPPALTALMEYRGMIDHPVRLWRAGSGFDRSASVDEARPSTK